VGRWQSRVDVQPDEADLQRVVETLTRVAADLAADGR
jgi:hypothetical protein